MNKDAAYWIAFAHLPRWTHLKINTLIIKFYHENKLSPEDFFRLSELDWKDQYGLEYKEIEDLKKTTHLAIAAHQDDVELMAYHGVCECYEKDEKFFTAVIVTNGSGSPKGEKYKKRKSKYSSTVMNFVYGAKIKKFSSFPP